MSWSPRDRQRSLLLPRRKIRRFGNDSASDADAMAVAALHACVPANAYSAAPLSANEPGTSIPEGRKWLSDPSPFRCSASIPSSVTRV
jgi:hypothetical protein